MQTPAPSVITVAAFERARRLAATRSIALIFGALLSLLTLAFLGFVVSGTLLSVTNPVVLLTVMMLFGCIGLYSLGVDCARKGRLQAGVVSTLVGALLSISLTTLFWKFLLHQGGSSVLLALLAGCTVVIVLAGTLGETWMIPAATVSMNLLTLMLLGFAPLAQGDLWLALAVLLAIQWAIAAITLATARNYRHTLNELGSAYTQVQGLDALKDQFITNINHELRTPIMALQGYVEYLYTARQEMDLDEEIEVIGRARRAGRNLITLLSSILDNRRMDQGADDFTPAAVPIFATLQQALSLIDPREGQLGTHDLQITLPQTWAIWGEAVRLQQIFLNLISNAMKYSPDHAPIQITARILPRKTTRWSGGQGIAQPQVEITVRDYGLGIPPEQVHLLFNRFARLPRDLASTVIGNGLGLHLCQVLARAMGGEITVESTGAVGEGSAFHVRLPLAPSLQLDSDATDPRMHVLHLSAAPAQEA
jgi:signal transduction histidine kinase